MSITNKISRTVENGLGWILGGLFLVWSLAYLLAHDTWQKVKSAWKNANWNSSYPVSGAMGGAAICGFLGGLPGALVGAIGGWTIGLLSSGAEKDKRTEEALKRYNPLDVDEDINIPARGPLPEIPVKKTKTKTKQQKVKKQSKTSKTSDTIVPPAPKKKPGRPRKSAKTE